MQKGFPEHSPDIGILLGDANKWALKHIKSNDPVVWGVAKRLLNLYAEHFALSSAVAKITQHKVELPDDLSNDSGRFEVRLKELPVDLNAELTSFKVELKKFILQVLPGAGTPNGPNTLVAPRGTITRLNKLNERATQLFRRAGAVPAVLNRLPLGYKRRIQPFTRGRKPKNRPK